MVNFSFTEAPVPYYNLNKKDKTIIFRLRTNQDRLIHNKYKNFKIAGTDQCLSSTIKQITSHILPTCPIYNDFGLNMALIQSWRPIKLYGCLEDLQRTAQLMKEPRLFI